MHKGNRLKAGNSQKRAKSNRLYDVLHPHSRDSFEKRKTESKYFTTETHHNKTKVRTTDERQRETPASKGLTPVGFKTQSSSSSA